MSGYWMWYPGDFELYHGMKQNFSRVERGYSWPAFWKSEGFRNRVTFRRSYRLENETDFTVYSCASGYVLAGDKKYPIGARIRCPAGEVSISIHVACIEKLPCVYVEGDDIFSDGDWYADDYSSPPVPAGISRYFTRKEQDPCVWEYDEKLYYPQKTERVGVGFLYEFETELTAELQISCDEERMRSMTAYFGESRDEALDCEHCYYSYRVQPDMPIGRTERCAFRYVYIPGDEVKLTARHLYVDIPVRASFLSDSEMLDRIWQVSVHTFKLCSGIFFIDGVKRDKWIWAGDAYQSFLLNRYLMADADIDRRTMLAIRGNDPMTGHINTIIDYSFLWVISVRDHFDFYGDDDFLRQIYPKVRTLIDFCITRTDDSGFITSADGDWVFIDWADIEKDGPVAAEQILFAAALEAAEQMAKKLGSDGDAYCRRRLGLLENINKYYWCEEKGAFIDSYTTGKCHVSRQTNIFALYFNIADSRQSSLILSSVINNGNVPMITTPYFKFFELDVLAASGQLDRVMNTVLSYWGGMLSCGATTFWEAFDPKDTTTAGRYDMYGDRFGKSLCHAWGAIPIYIIAKHFVGLKVCGGRFVLSPRTEFFKRLDCTLPLDGDGGYVRVQIVEEKVTVETNRAGGIIQLGGREYRLDKKVSLSTYT